MSTTPSLADKAIEALAAVATMGDNININHPERHHIRRLREVATCIIEQALLNAIDLSWQAKDLSKTVREIEKTGAAS